MKAKLLLFSVFGPAALACSLFSFPASTPDAGPVPVTQVSSTPPGVPALTADQLKNARYQLVFQDSHPTVQLTNGTYQSGNDPTSADFVSVRLAEPMAFGDLNGDGADDAAVLLAENYGGTGVFVSMIVVLNNHGQPVQAASEMIDDRPILNGLSIQDAQIALDATLHGPDDPGCCAAQPTRRSYRYAAGRLEMSSFTTQTADGRERLITIDSPSDGSQAAWPLTVSGSVTIAPFENNLVYSVFDANNNQVTVGPFPVSADQPGGPGTFSLLLDLRSAGVTGPLRIQIEDSSPADGSILALAAVRVIIK